MLSTRQKASRVGWVERDLEQSHCSTLEQPQKQCRAAIQAGMQAAFQGCVIYGMTVCEALLQTAEPIRSTSHLARPFKPQVSQTLSCYAGGAQMLSSQH